MMDDKEKLKPCPFCGNQEIMLVANGMWACWCTKCFASSGYAISKEDAVKMWNRRVEEIERKGGI